MLNGILLAARAQAVLKRDATVRDVLSSLDQAEDYMIIVLGHLSECRKRHGNAEVRIGTTGKGIMPCHRIEYIDASGERRILGAWDGKNKFVDVKIHENTWSESSMNLVEFRALLGEYRQIKHGR